MHRLLGAAVIAACFALPAAAAAQQATATARQPSPFAALEIADQLQLTPEQSAAITVARDSLRQAHRIHCGPMHASTPTPAEEERHHAEMAQINARWEGQARAALTAAQQERLAALGPAPAAQQHQGEHHQPASGSGHGGHHPAPATPAHTGGHPRD